MMIAGWSLLGTGVVLGVLGGACAALAKQKQKDVETARDNGAEWSTVKSTDDDGRSLKGTAIVGVALGGIAAVTGAILLIIDWRANVAAEKRSAYLLPAPIPGGGLVSAGLRF